MDLIVPCAGLSSRFPDSLPKYVLSCFNGNMVLQNVLDNYIKSKHFDNIYVTILKEHEIKYNIIHRLNYIFGESIKIVVLPDRTNGSADTVYQTLKRINTNGPFLVRDCDSFFNHNLEIGNVVYCNHIGSNKNLQAKSYIKTNDQNIITNIIEKNIVSEYFCVGGYQFSSAREFIVKFEQLQSNSNEIYISEIIGSMINSGEIFIKSLVSDYIDVGTIDEFNDYNNKPTYFSDIDGVICKVQSRYDINPFETYEPIQKNIDVLLQKLKTGCQIIFTTARDPKFEKQTKNMLTEMGFGGCILIMNIHRAKRIVINDFNNYYPTCDSICIKSESPELFKYINN
jgi:hypothetical protein